MKIVHIVWGLKNGGAENMLADIINIQILTEDVTLLVINDMLDPTILSRIDKKCKVLSLRRKTGSKNLWYFMKLNYMILSGHYDIVHLHQNTIIGKLLVRANYVRTVHNTKQSFHDYHNHKSIIAISSAVKEELDSLGYTKSVLINNGVNFSLIRYDKKQTSDVTFKIIQVSRILFRQKGQDILLKAFNKIVKKGYGDVHLYFIGDGPDRDKLEYMVKQLGISNNVFLLGDCSREYIYENLCNFDLYVQPSRFEGFGLTVVEAMAAKIPVLVSRNEGPFQIIGNGKYGFCFKNGESDDAAEQIIRIINDYPNDDFLEKAYNHAKILYSVEETAKSYLEEYKKVLSQQ